MGVIRNRSGESGDGGVNLSEAGLEHLRILQGQLTEYRQGPQQGHNQNLFLGIILRLRRTKGRC